MIVFQWWLNNTVSNISLSSAVFTYTPNTHWTESVSIITVDLITEWRADAEGASVEDT